jgi:hypothetical protein
LSFPRKKEGWGKTGGMPKDIASRSITHRSPLLSPIGGDRSPNALRAPAKGRRFPFKFLPSTLHSLGMGGFSSKGAV